MGAETGSLEASIGYGFASPWGVFTPFTEAGLADGASHVRLGTRFRASSAALDVELSGERRERAHSLPEHAANFKTTYRY